MFNSKKTISVKIALIACIVSCAIGYFYAQKTIPVKVEIKEKEVTKNTQTVKKDVKITKRKIKRPDGTIETEKVIENKTQTNNTVISKRENEKIISNRKNWQFGYMAGGVVGNPLSSIQAHGLYLQRRIIGPFIGGVYGQSNGCFGIMLGVEF